MDIRQIKAFVAIAETGTFTAGAVRVHVTQAAISMQIRQLETETGAQLFVRAPRRVILTEAGEKLLERAYVILREHDAALEELAALTGAHRGRLRIGSASAMVSADPLPQVLRELRKVHPGVETSVASGTSESLVAQVLAGELDAAFVSLPVEARGVQTELLSEDSLVAIASTRHKLAKQKVVSAYALAGEKLILGERGGNTRRLIDQFFAHAGVSLKVVMELSRLAAIKRMVEEEMGVGIVPLKSVREEVEKGTLVRWWIEGAQINWQLGIARLVGGYESPIHLTFLQLCREHFRDPAATPPPKQKPKQKKKAVGR
ncbi:MAG: LysR family transcriptional regulator [Acidobacteriota bacterium]